MLLFLSDTKTRRQLPFDRDSIVSVILGDCSRFDRSEFAKPERPLHKLGWRSSPGTVLVSGLLGDTRGLLGFRTLAKSARSRDRGYSTIESSRLCKRRSPQTNGSCPEPSPGVPLCQSCTRPSSACYSVTSPLRSQPIRRSHPATA